MTRRLLTGLALVAAFILGWTVRGDRASAQERKPIMMTRIYTGADGLSHAEEVPMKFANGGATEMMKATGVDFSRRPPGPVARQPLVAGLLGDPARAAHVAYAGAGRAVEHGTDEL